MMVKPHFDREMALNYFWTQTFSFLDDKDLARLQRVCKTWKAIIDKIWKGWAPLDYGGKKITRRDQLRLSHSLRSRNWQREERSLFESFVKAGIKIQKTSHLSYMVFAEDALFFSLTFRTSVYKWDMKNERKITSYNADFKIKSFVVLSVPSLIAILSSEQKKIKIYKYPERERREIHSLQIEKNSKDYFTIENGYIIRHVGKWLNGTYKIWDLKDFDQNKCSLFNPGEGPFNFYLGMPYCLCASYDLEKIVIFNRLDNQQSSFLNPEKYGNFVYYFDYFFCLGTQAPSILLQLDFINDSQKHFDCQEKITDIFSDAKHLFIQTEHPKGFSIKLFEAERLRRGELVCSKSYSFKGETAIHFRQLISRDEAFNTLREFGEYFFRMSSGKKESVFAICDKKRQIVSTMFYELHHLARRPGRLDYVVECNPFSIEWYTYDLKVLKFFPNEEKSPVVQTTPESGKHLKKRQKN